MIILTSPSPYNPSQVASGPIRASLAEAGCSLYTYDQVDLVNKLKPKHVILFSGIGDYKKGSITRVAERLSKDITIGWWFGDLRDPDEHLHQHSLENIDHMFVPSKNWFERYNAFGPKASYVPQPGYAYCTDTYQYSKVNEFDAIFIGQVNTQDRWHFNREQILKKFKSHCRVGLVSNQESTPSQTYIYNNVPISISITHPDAICYSSNRLYNILAAGGLVFQNYIQQLDEVFTDREHLVYFKSLEEIPDLVSHYLKNPEEVLKIKRAARKIFEEKHTARARINNMVDIMDNKTTDYYGYLK